MGPVRRVAGEMFASLRHRNFRLFWTGQLISVTGNWMNQVAQGWLVLELSNSSVVLGTVGALQWLPVLLLSAFAGAIADRYPKRRVLMWTQSALLVLAAALGTLTVTGHVRIWHVMVVAALTGVINALDNPTRQSFIVELVGKQDLANAIALNSSLFNAARVVGPSLGGFVIGAFGVGVAFLLNAASYVAVLVGLALMSVMAETPKPARRRLLAEVGEGLAYLRATPSVSWPIILLGVVSLFAINWNILLPLLAKHVLRIGPEGLGLLYTALGLGALVGALALAANSHRPIGFANVASYAVAFSATQLLVGLAPNFYVDLVLLACAGYTMIRFTASSNSLVQSLVPDGLRARVMSVYFLVFGGSSPFGNEFAGAVAAGWGPQAAFVAGAVLAGAFAAYVWLREARRPAAEAASGSSPGTG